MTSDNADRHILLVDVDLTVEQTVGERWSQWLMELYGSSYDPHKDSCINYGDIEYNLSNYYTDDAIFLIKDPFDFWRQEDLYDHSVPAEGSVEVLEEMKANGFDIVFVSTLKGNHHRSKYYFLNQHFGHIMDGFLGTHEKHYVRGGAIIDDRMDHLNSMEKSVKTVLMESPYRQKELANREVLVYNWNMGAKALIDFIDK